MAATNKIDKMSNNNYFIVLLLVSLLVVGGTVLGVKALVGGIIVDTKVLTAKNTANKQLEQNLAAAPQLVSSFETLGNQRNLISDALPDTADLPALIAMAENMAAANGANLKSVSPSLAGTVATGPTGSHATVDTTGVPKPKPYSLSLAFDGNYGSLQKLLAAFEQSARPMRVTSIQLSGSGASLAAQIEATTYYQDKATLPISQEVVK